MSFHRAICLLSTFFLILAPTKGVEADVGDFLASNADYLEERLPRRLALVIGNFDYTSHVKLPGVESDVRNVADGFRRLNFDVVSEHSNVKTWEDFQYEVLKPFRALVQRDDLVVVYLSGHGFAYNGFQYFAPSGMPEKLVEGSIATSAVPIESIVGLFGIEGPGAVLLIVDACRTVASDLIVKEDGRSVEKGGYNGVRKSPNTEYILALSVGSGLPSVASSDPATMSAYTQALVVPRHGL